MLNIDKTSLRWSSSTSAFASCQCAATKPHPCNILHVMFTSVFFSMNKSFRPEPSSRSQRGSVYQESLELFWVMFTRAVSESLHLPPIPSSEKSIISCVIFMRSPDESNYPQAIQFLIERSHLPPARSYY